MSPRPATLVDPVAQLQLTTDGFTIVGHRTADRRRLGAVVPPDPSTSPHGVHRHDPTRRHGVPQRSPSRRARRCSARSSIASSLDHRIVAGNFVVKQPGPWTVEPHQDFDFLDESRWVAVLGWIPLHDVDARNGCLHVVPGSHRLSTLPRGSGHHRFPLDPVIAHLKANRSVAAPLRRGTAVLYDSRTLHWSTGNETDSERSAAAFAAIPKKAELLHFHVNADDTVTVLTVDDDIYADTPFHAYPVRGSVVSIERLGPTTAYDPSSVDRALDDRGERPAHDAGKATTPEGRP